MDKENLAAKKLSQFKIGLLIFILLAVLTAVEYGIAWFGKNLVFILILIALFKAFLVIRDYMHIGRLFSSEEE